MIWFQLANVRVTRNSRGRSVNPYPLRGHTAGADAVEGPVGAYSYVTGNSSITRVRPGTTDGHWRGTRRRRSGSRLFGGDGTGSRRLQLLTSRPRSLRANASRCHPRDSASPRACGRRRFFLSHRQRSVSFGWQATRGLSTIARSAKVDRPPSERARFPANDSCQRCNPMSAFAASRRMPAVQRQLPVFDRLRSRRRSS